MTNGNAASVTVIEGGRSLGSDLLELWRYRELFYFLTWRDIKVRYKQTILGAGWAILCPFLSMVVFSIFFGRLGGLNQRTGGIPYPLFVYPGEREMEALAFGALRVLRGEEQARSYGAGTKGAIS